jgi:hypothetical protein
MTKFQIAIFVFSLFACNRIQDKTNDAGFNDNDGAMWITDGRELPASDSQSPKQWKWSKQGPAHHCAIGVGHIADKIQKLAKIFNIDAVKIC